MTDQDEFFRPEEVDTQIERASQFQEGDRADAEVIAYLRGFYQTDAQQESLDRMWNRIRRVAPWEHDQQEQEKEQSMQNWQMEYNSNLGRVRPQHSRPSSPIRQRLGVLAAVIVALVLVSSLALVFYAVRHTNGGTPATHPNSPPGSVSVPLKVTSVDMSVTPHSIAGLLCGTNLTVTYTAVFHVTPKSAGGTVQFNYTINNGRGQTMASIKFSPGQTSKAYSFTWSGALPIDHTYPGEGGVEVTSPNQLLSALVEPTGTCTPAAAFQVTKVTMTVSPASIQGLACGTSLVVDYTATIYVAPNSLGGTVQFNYTINNGRGQTMASIKFSPGQTSKTYTFTWSGALPADHTAPGQGGIEVTSPNQLLSALVKPTGTCS
jgi:hypothetical protein